MFHKGTQLHTKEMSVLFFHQISNMTKLILFKVIFIRWFHGLQDVLMETDIFLLIIRLQDVLVKTNIFVLSFKRSCKNDFKTSSRRLQDLFKTSCQYFFKTSSRRLANTFWRHLHDILKTSSKHPQDVFLRRLQDVFKTYHQVKLFLLTNLWEVFNMFVRCTAKTIVYRRIHLGHTSEKFMVTVQNLQEW